jgi:hypothetical protein
MKTIIGSVCRLSMMPTFGSIMYRLYFTGGGGGILKLLEVDPNLTQRNLTVTAKRICLVTKYPKNRTSGSRYEIYLPRKRQSCGWLYDLVKQNANWSVSYNQQSKHVARRK